MKKIIVFVLLFFSVGVLNVFSQSADCYNPDPFCTGTNYSFPASTNAPSAPAGPYYDCLGSQPNPAFYFMQIDQPGNLTIDMGTTPLQDIDFICWGPFADSSAMCNNLTAANVVDCSYSILPTETCNIYNAISGEFYMLMITNFSNNPCDIYFSQTSGNGTCMTFIYGCIDSLANNYNPNANTEDGSCTYLGCTDSTACNYDVSAITDDGSCLTDYGCTDVTALNYDSTATCDDGSCIPFIYGCTDSTACNYDASANTDDGSCLYGGYGCTDVTAFNYDSTATCDDGSCIPFIYGCMDSTAFNFNQLSINNTDTIYYDDCSDINTWNVTNSSTQGFAWEIEMDPNAISFTALSPFASTTAANGFMFISSDLNGGPDGNGTTISTEFTNATPIDLTNYPNVQLTFQHNFGWWKDTRIVRISPDNGATWVEIDEISNEYNYSYPNQFSDNPHMSTYDISSVAGGMSEVLVQFYYNDNDIWAWYWAVDDIAISKFPTDTNLYYPNTDDGSCCYISGCTDATAYNYDSTACYDDGSCISFIYGCMDSTAFNYDVSVNTDDGSCCYISGCTDSSALNYDSTACFDDGSCISFIYGCMDSTAFNYDVSANTDVGSCCYSNYTIVVNNGSIAGDNWWWAQNQAQTSALAFGYNYQIINQDSADVQSFCTNDSCFSLSLYSSSATGWNGGSIEVYQNGLFLSSYTLPAPIGASVTYFVCAQAQVVSGCTDPTATNYDPSATVDDGSCTYTAPCTDYVTGLTTPTVLEDRVIMAWDNMNTSACSVTKYNVRFREAGTTAWDQKGAGWLGCSTPGGLQKVDRLQLNMNPSTTYEWKMKVWYCDGNSSYWGATEQFTTQGSCPDLANLQVQTFPGNHTRALFTWDSTLTYEYARVKLRVDTVGATWLTAGGFGVYLPLMEANKFGLVPGESYRGQAQAYCHPVMSAWASNWTPLIFWTQPDAGSKLEGGTAITNLDVYPNPSRDVFNISFTSETIQDLKVRVMNVIGEELISDDLQQFIGEYTKQINLEDNAKGIYFLEIETNDGVINKKLILQ